MKHIVKRAGHSQIYDERKLYASIYASCIVVSTPMATAELLASAVCKQMAFWLENKKEVTSADIRRWAAHYLHALHTDAAWIYQHHRNIY